MADLVQPQLTPEDTFLPLDYVGCLRSAELNICYPFFLTPIFMCVM